MKPSEILKEAFKQVENPERWGGTCMALDAAGEPVYYRSSAAKKFSAHGAVSLVCLADETFAKMSAVAILERVVPEGEIARGRRELGVISYNRAIYPDHSKLKAWFDKAVQLAEEYEYEAIGDPAQGTEFDVQSGGMVA